MEYDSTDWTEDEIHDWWLFAKHPLAEKARSRLLRGYLYGQASKYQTDADYLLNAKEMRRVVRDLGKGYKATPQLCQAEMQ